MPRRQSSAPATGSLGQSGDLPPRSSDASDSFNPPVPCNQYTCEGKRPRYNLILSVNRIRLGPFSGRIHRTRPIREFVDVVFEMTSPATCPETGSWPAECESISYLPDKTPTMTERQTRDGFRGFRTCRPQSGTRIRLISGLRPKTGIQRYRRGPNRSSRSTSVRS